MKLNRKNLILFAIALIIKLNILPTNSFSLKVTNKSKSKIQRNSEKGPYSGGLFAIPINKPSDDPSQVQKPKPFYNPNIAGDLVTAKTRPQCPVIEEKLKRVMKAKKPETGNYLTEGPRMKVSPYKIMSTKNTAYINYLFDYLDEFVIKKLNNKKITEILTKNFTEAFEDAKKMKKTHPKYSNFYTAPKLLFFFSKGAAGTEPFTDPRLVSEKNINNNQIDTPSGMTPASKQSSVNPVPDDAPVPQAVWDAILSHNKNFNKKIFDNSITPIQLLHILDEWEWSPAGTEWDILELKKLVDHYDFNGDGNLNPEEFTILQIHLTVKAGYQCRKHCLREVIEIALEPLFMYLDCDSDGYINSENMWEGFKNVYRANSKKYNMYQCNFPLELNKDYRTNTVNDFILKVSYAADGFLNKNEFITGLLSGFWERQTDENNYGDSPDKLEGLKNRWGNKGDKDIECDKIMYYFNNQS